MKTVMFDIDGVLADFVGGFTRLAHTLYGTPVTHTSYQPTWDGYPGLNQHVINGTWEVLKRDWEFWFKLDPLVEYETFARIQDIAKQNELYFVTSRVGVEAKQQTEAWLRKYGVLNPTVIISRDKGEAANILGATHAIDDKAGNSVAIQYMSRAQSFIIDRPYNQFDHTVIGTKVLRVPSVDTFISLIGIKQEEKIAA